MKRVFFIFGYNVSSWGDGGGGKWFTKKGFIEIPFKHDTTVAGIVDDVRALLKRAVTEDVLEKEYRDSSEGDSGGRFQEFTYYFWGLDTEAVKEKTLRDLTVGLRAVLPDIFTMPKEWK